MDIITCRHWVKPRKYSLTTSEIPSILLNGYHQVSLPGLWWPRRGVAYPLHLAPRLKEEQRYIPVPPPWVFMFCSRMSITLHLISGPVFESVIWSMVIAQISLTHCSERSITYETAKEQQWGNDSTKQFEVVCVCVCVCVCVWRFNYSLTTRTSIKSSAFYLQCTYGYRMTFTTNSNEFPTKHNRPVFERTQAVFSAGFELNFILQKGFKLEILSLLIRNHTANGVLRDVVQW